MPCRPQLSQGRPDCCVTGPAQTPPAPLTRGLNCCPKPGPASPSTPRTEPSPGAPFPHIYVCVCVCGNKRARVPTPLRNARCRSPRGVRPNVGRAGKGSRGGGNWDARETRDVARGSALGVDFGPRAAPKRPAGARNGPPRGAGRGAAVSRARAFKSAPGLGPGGAAPEIRGPWPRRALHARGQTGGRESA
eukprot:scaffold1970_cov396-Prasinococcus_capsulatus_cf.AAC.17